MRHSAYTAAGRQHIAGQHQQRRSPAKHTSAATPVALLLLLPIPCSAAAAADAVDEQMLPVHQLLSLLQAQAIKLPTRPNTHLQRLALRQPLDALCCGCCCLDRGLVEARALLLGSCTQPANSTATAI
jgi:hypothetical protein